MYVLCIINFLPPHLFYCVCCIAYETDSKLLETFILTFSPEEVDCNSSIMHTLAGSLNQAMLLPDADCLRGDK